MMKQIFFIAFLYSFAAGCNLQNQKRLNMGGQYDNLDKFGSVINHYHDSIGKKYAIKDYGFDVECIYQKEDLTNLVKEMIAVGGFIIQQSRDWHDSIADKYFTEITIGNKPYGFSTTSKGDYVDMETVMPGLQQITKDFKPDYEYNFSNRNGGQIAFLIFGKSGDLINAVNEGYPCSLKSGNWAWDDEQWDWGTYTDIQLQNIPNFEDLKTKYYQTLQELYKKGYNVPNLTIQRIYLDDIYQKNTIDIVIDGGPMTTSFNDIVGNKIRCFWDGWGVALAYTLVKYYQGEPSLFKKEEKVTIKLTGEEFIKMAETAFKKTKHY